MDDDRDFSESGWSGPGMLGPRLPRAAPSSAAPGEEHGGERPRPRSRLTGRTRPRSAGEPDAPLSRAAARPRKGKPKRPRGR